jgi:hypothetical protein
MRFKILVLSLVFLCFKSTQAQMDSLQIKPLRLAIVSSSTLAVLGGSYIYVKNSWWSEKTTSFHFDDGSDLRYAKNIDKGGHFFGGILVADLFQSSLKWSGTEEKKSYLYGAAMGSFVQFGIDLKDGYAPYWGFSAWDFGAGILGAFVPYAERYWSAMEYMDFKFSYYKRSNHYWDLGSQLPTQLSKYAYQDDYINQTYWITTYPFKDLGSDIGIAIGFGLDDTQEIIALTKVGGRNEIYLSLDYDMLRVLKRWDTPTAKKIKYWLNYFKFPAPTIRISPSVEFYPFFM